MIPESLWSSETDAAMDQQTEIEATETEPVPSVVSAEAEAPETENEAHEIENGETAPTVALAVSTDDFAALEQRVLRAVEMLKHERQARASAEVRIAEAEECAASTLAQLGPLQAQVDHQTPLIEQLQSEILSLRAERDTVRQRVERLLEQLDSLEI